MHTYVAIMVVFELVALIGLVPVSLIQFKLDRRQGTYDGRLGVIGCGILLLVMLEGHLEMLLSWGMK